MRVVGKKNWIIPDCELPPEGDGVLKGHESVVIVNDSAKTAVIKVKLYFTDKKPYDGITWLVEPQTVKCFRMNNVEHMCGFIVPLETQYAMKLESSQKIVVQYGRLDNRQTNLAYYTTLAY
ncbi:MAG: hypothetical protein IJ329_03550 [Clostridia bacterium]|nr:hypothetical protein [Clostridia bacterium]